MARRIRWQILIAVVSAVLVLGMMSYLALTTAAVARPLAGGGYVEGLVGTPRQLNPLLSDPARDPVAADVRALVFEGLMRTGVDGLPEPALAAALPAIDETGTIYTFTLRSDAVWHDGTPLSADDVVFTVRAIQSPAFSGDAVASGVWRNVLVSKINDQQVQLTLPIPVASFQALATFPILPAHILRDVPPAQWATNGFSTKPIGTGPYQFESLSATGATFRANERYHGGRPLLDTIEFRFFGSQQEAQAALSRGEIVGLGGAGLDGYGVIDVPQNERRVTLPLDTYVVLSFNLRRAPTNDQGLRRALALGLDKDALITSTLQGQARRLDTPILPESWAAVPDLVWYPASQGQASDTLNSLGYEPGPNSIRQRDGQPLRLELITDAASGHLVAAQNIAQQWAALGVQVDVQEVDTATLEQRLRDHDFVVAIHGWQRLGPDPDVVYPLWHSSEAENGSNYAGLQDEELDSYLDDARQNGDIGARAADYEAFQRRWIELVPGIMLYQPVFQYIVPSDLDGLELAPAQAPQDQSMIVPFLAGRESRFRNVSGWFVRSAREIGGDLRTAP